MRIFGPIYCILVQMLSVCQEPKFSMIIKTFVTLSTLSNMDFMFAAHLPQVVKDNAAEINRNQAFKMSYD